MNKIVQLELFPEFGSKKVKREKDIWKSNFIFAPNNRFSLSICENVNFSSTYQMPIVNGCSIELPKDICCFYRLHNRNYSGVVPHFYTTDNRLLPFVNNPYRHLEMISNHPVVIGLDLSIKPEMPIPMKMGISFYNKLMMAWWQKQGKIVVPNVVIDPSIIDCCLDGYPKNSVIAMNSSGIGKDKRAMNNWQIIYPHVIEKLNPKFIIRYGGKQPDEMENISAYYENDNKKFYRYGR